MVIFQLIRMSSYAKNKLLMCLFTQHQCRRRQIWAKLSQIHPVHSLYICYRKWHVLAENLFMVMFQLMRMFSYAKNKLQMCSVNQHLCRRRQMWANLSQTQTHKKWVYTHFLSVSENDLSLFIVMFQLMRMSSYAKNKPQMCSVTQHECRRRKMWGNFSQIHPVHSHFVCYKKLLVLTEQSIHGNFSTH